MGRIIVLVLAIQMLFLSKLSAQSNTQILGNTQTIVETPDSPAVFKDGNFDEFIQKNLHLNYPCGDVEYHAFINVSFIITKEGRIGYIQFLHKELFGFNKDISRFIMLTDGKWRPAILKGLPVASKQTFSVKITIPN